LAANLRDDVLLGEGHAAVCIITGGLRVSFPETDCPSGLSRNRT
jgi:hypothetical protein